MEIKQERNYTDKLFFAIYKKEGKKFHHMIVYRKNKKELRDSGYTPKGILSQKDIEKVRNNTFLDINVSDKVLDYLKDNLDDWNNQF